MQFLQPGHGQRIAEDLGSVVDNGALGACSAPVRSRASWLDLSRGLS